jgi:nitric oxide reductase NorQ protein
MTVAEPLTPPKTKNKPRTNTTMTKDNLQYTPVEPEDSVDSALDSLLSSGSHEDLKVFSSDIPELAKTILAWSLYPVSDSLSPYMRNEVTKGSHAEGRSLSNSESEPEVEATPQERFYLRPNGDKYYHRPWGPDKNDVEVLRASRLSNLFPLLYGPPGTGKTAMVEAAYGEELITLLGTGDTEIADFVGGYIQDESGAFQWVDGPLLRAAEEGKPFLIDEVGIIDPKVMTVVYGLMDGRREYTVTANPARGTVKAAEGFFVIGATNPNAPGVRLSEALLSRFTLHVEVLTDYGMAQEMGVNKHIISTAKSLDNRVRQGEVDWAPQFRELLAFRDISAIFGQRFAIENLIAAAPESARQDIVDTIKKGPLGSNFSPARIG